MIKETNVSMETRCFAKDLFSYFQGGMLLSWLVALIIYFPPV